MINLCYIKIIIADMWFVWREGQSNSSHQNCGNTGISGKLLNKKQYNIKPLHLLFLFMFICSHFTSVQYNDQPLHYFIHLHSEMSSSTHYIKSKTTFLLFYFFIVTNLFLGVIQMISLECQEMTGFFSLIMACVWDTVWAYPITA